MKTLSPGISTILQQRLGLEPVNILSVQWVEDGSWLQYADKDISDAIPGKILTISTLESVVKLDSQGQSQGISVILSDTGGALKDIFNNHDIHGRRVKLLQWFEGLAIEEAFELYEGEISSPIVWNEGDRTLSFEVITKLSDKEIGFSPEEGFFLFLPDEMVGKPWPLAFGKVGGVPATRLNEIPNSNLAEPLAVKDPSLATRARDLQEQIDAIGDAIYAAALYAGIAAFRCDFEGLTEWCAIQQQYEDYQKQLAAHSDQLEAELISIWAESAAQDEYNDGTLLVANGENFPQGETITLEVDTVILTGYFDGNTFHIESADPAVNSNYLYNSSDPEPFGFTWVREGTQIRIQTSHPIVYIANLLPSEVQMVQVIEQVDNGEVLIAVPPDLYTVNTLDIGPYTITYITFDKPPSSYNERYGDDIYVTMTSSVGPNTVDILIWLIETYTDLDYDIQSFQYVRLKLTNYPSNFALLQRKDIIQTLEEIAFQARCSIWISNNVFYIRYLSEERVASDTITEDDIDVEKSFSISLSNTEEIVTKLTANWYYMYTQDEPNRIVLRHNVKKYGTREREIDFYIYNIQELVLKSATFWLVRFANMWKHIEFTTYMDKLAIETFDIIEFNFTEPYLANAAVSGMITENTYDSDEKTLTMKAWIPVRAGEMEQYDFAQPCNISTQLFYPTPLEIGEGWAGGDGPGAEVDGTEITRHLGIRPYSVTVVASRDEYEQTGRRFQYRDWGDQVPSDLDDAMPTITFSGDTGIVGSDHNRAYNYGSYDYPQLGGISGESDEKSRCYPGVIVGGGGEGSQNQYDVNVYINGLINEPTVCAVKQLQIGQDIVLPSGTWVLVAANKMENTFDLEGNPTEHTEYTMQVPVWL